jgi:hypothetical protein
MNKNWNYAKARNEWLIYITRKIKKVIKRIYCVISDTKEVYSVFCLRYIFNPIITFQDI